MAGDLRSAAAARALAHPLRPRLLALLRREGPATASDLARRVGLSSGDTSYHLRQLARFGLIEEDDSQQSGRERWWRAAAPATSLDPRKLRRRDFREAMRAVQQVRLSMHAAAIDALLGASDVPGEWRESLSTSDFELALTPQELGELLDALHKVVAKRSRADAEPGGRRRVRLVIDAVPLVDDQ